MGITVVFVTGLFRLKLGARLLPRTITYCARKGVTNRGHPARGRLARLNPVQYDTQTCSDPIYFGNRVKSIV